VPHDRFDSNVHVHPAHLPDLKMRGPYLLKRKETRRTMLDFSARITTGIFNEAMAANSVFLISFFNNHFQLNTKLNNKSCSVNPVSRNFAFIIITLSIQGRTKWRLENQCGMTTTYEIYCSWFSQQHNFRLENSRHIVNASVLFHFHANFRAWKKWSSRYACHYLT
jgi:hypothetical protein